MGAIHDVLRYLLERVPPRTQDEHDEIAALIEADEQPKAEPAEPDSETGATEEEQRS